MGHAEHFLSRLSRLAPDQEQLALALYRDAPLVRQILREAQAPEGATRIALALAEEPEPPHIIVARDGGFVTCLASGMRFDDLPVISFSRMRGLQQQVISLREIFRHAIATVNEPGITRIARSLVENGSSVTAEEMRTALAIAPLWGTSLARPFAKLTDDTIALREQLNNWPHPERWSQSSRGEEKLRLLWQSSWALSHYALLVIAAGAGQKETEFLLRKNLLDHMFFQAMESGFLPMAVRLTWTLAQGGPAIAEAFEVEAEAQGIGLVEIFCGVAMAALGNADPMVRETALRFFSDRAVRKNSDPDVDSHLLAVSKAMTDQPEHHATLVEYGRRLLWDRLQWENRVRWSDKSHIPERLARAEVACLELDMHRHHNVGFNLFLKCIPWLSKASAEELYLPAAEHPPRDRFLVETGLLLVEGSVPSFRKQKPVVAAVVPGRNDPCPCGSGKKFKKCHAQ